MLLFVTVLLVVGSGLFLFITSQLNNKGQKACQPEPYPCIPVRATKLLNSPVTLPEMASEEVTYADLRFMTLEKSQDQKLQTARAKDSPCPSSCWRLATVALLVFCLSSVAAVGVLAARFILVCHLVCERDENFTLQKAIMESLNQQLELLQAQNLNLTETVKQLAPFKGHKCIPCPENWLQYGESCYHFSKEWKTWEESKAQCSALESRLLKIERLRNAISTVLQFLLFLDWAVSQRN
ncbi:C-type lectin domain family 12 member A-like isoform X3 [Phalacrocorax aristotelis]|uniref:C-type lectin domain family 12 member A-like isoform X3 n=1 Tax=Phalacrocorax aristotelis TaxID=126867 RepID=UPI003F4B4FE2